MKLEVDFADEVALVACVDKVLLKPAIWLRGAEVGMAA